MQGTFAGHATPGIMFILYAIWSAIKQAHNHVRFGNRTVVQYPVAYLKQHTFSKKSYRAPGFSPTDVVTIVRDAPLFPHDKLVEGVFFLLCSCGGALGILGYRQFEFIDRHGEFSSNLNNWQHGTMFAFFGLHFSVVVLGQTRHRLQPKMEKLLQSLPFFVEAFLFYFHLEGRDDPLDVHLHHLLLITIMGTAVCLLAQTWKLGDPLLDQLWVVFLLLHGMWFLMVGFVLYNPIQHVTTWDRDPMKSMMMATALFSWQFLLAIIINSLIRWIVWFLVTRNHGDHINNTGIPQFADDYGPAELNGDYNVEDKVEMVGLLDETQCANDIDEDV